ncbi:MAG: methyltransferase [Parvularculales bacterium]
MMAESIDVSNDCFLGGQLKIWQSTRGYRAGHDAVLLGASVPAQGGECVLDAGGGAGVAGLCVGMRVEGVRLVCLDNDETQAKLARENLARNAQTGDSLVGDLTGVLSDLEGVGLKKGSFDHVLSNPPYRVEGASTLPVNKGRAQAFVLHTSLGAWVERCCFFAKIGGTVTFIYLAHEISSLVVAMSAHCGDIKIMPLWPHAGTPARRIIIQGRRGARGKDAVLPGLVLHEAGGSATKAADDVLRGCIGLKGLI